MRGEGVGESVEYGAVFRVAAGVVSVGGILLAEDVTEEAALLLKNVFGHHQREVDDMLRLLLSRQQKGHYPTPHANDGGTTAVGVHDAVDALECLLTLVLDPLGDGLAQPWGVDKAVLGAKGVHGGEDGLGITVPAVLKRGHRSEG